MNFQEFKEKYEKIPVEHYPHEVVDNPVVSVCVQTYNHEPYIKECLDGILKQKTDFPIEILIGEDASKDGTREICIEYAQKYPDKIRLFLHHRKNNIKISGQPTGRFNFLYNLHSARGKYIALCEGDDYWVDPLKLQKQVEFMEENEDYGLVHTDCDIYDHKKRHWKRNANKDLFNNKSYLKRDILFKFLINGKYKVRTATTLFRSKIFDEVDEDVYRFKMGDTPLWIEILHLSKLKYLDESTSVYRVHNTSASNYLGTIDRLLFRMNGLEMRYYYCGKYGYPLKWIRKRYNKSLIRVKTLKPDYEEQYSLITPSIFERIKFRLLNNNMFRMYFLSLFYVSNLIKKALKKM